MKVRLPDTRYDDEIGRLCKTINQMAEDLAETERLKNEFISSVSHELRTPLTSIRGWVETISNIDDPTNENYRRGLSIIGTETDRLYTMVEELLDFSRMQNGIKMNCEVLDFVAEAPTPRCSWRPASGRRDAARLLRAARAVPGLGRPRAAAAGVCKSVR